MGKVLRSYKTLLRRGIAVVVIALLIALAFAPGINAVVEKSILPKNEKLVRLLVTEHKPDGTRESKIVRLPESQAKELKERLENVEDIDERLSVYKEYGLIPERVTNQKLRDGMEEKARQLGLSKEKLEKMSLNLNTILCNNERVTIKNYFCLLTALWIIGIPFFIGTSSVMWRINFILESLGRQLILPGFDFVDFIACLGMGEVRTQLGLLPAESTWFQGYILLLIGFVGFTIGYLPHLFWGELFGFASVAYAIGHPVL